MLLRQERVWLKPVANKHNSFFQNNLKSLELDKIDTFNVHNKEQYSNNL